MNWIINLYKTNPFVHGLVSALEGGVITGLSTWLGMGLPFNKQSLIALGGAVGGGIITALRNYFKNRLNQPATLNAVSF